MRLSDRPQLVAIASIAVGIVLLVAKLLTGLVTGSLGLISEAAHSAMDLIASIFALIAIRTGRKPADPEHPYGHGRAENLSAFAEGLLLLITAGGIGYEGVRRLLGATAHVDAAWYAFALLVANALIEAGRATVLRRVGRAAGSHALEADAENRTADVLSTLGVLAGLIGVRLGYQWADAIAAVLVAALVFRAAALLIWRSGDILMDRAPLGLEDQIRQTIAEVGGVRSVGPVRVRRSGPRIFGDATLSARRMLSVEGAQSLSDHVREAVKEAHPDLDLTLVVEADASATNMVERVHAAAARHGRIHDLHNVTVEKEADGSLHLSMHAKLPANLQLKDAAATSAELEKSLHREFPEVSRVDVHLEPLEPDVVRGRDVTARRPKLAGRIRRLVEGHPKVLRGRDVELSSRKGSITAYVVAEMPGGVTLQEAHEVETELELMIAKAIPELHEVVARVTP